MVGKKSRLAIDSASLKKAVEESAYSLEDISSEVGVSLNTLKRWLNGNIKSIKKENLVKLSQILQVPEKSLLISSEDAIADVNTEQYDELFIDLFHLNKWDSIKMLIDSMLSTSLDNGIVVRFYQYLALTAILKTDFDVARMYAKKIEKVEKEEKRISNLIEAFVSVLEGEWEKSGEIFKSVERKDDTTGALSLVFESLYERLASTDEKAYELLNQSESFFETKEQNSVFSACKMAVYCLKIEILISENNLPKSLQYLDKLKELVAVHHNNRFKAVSVVLESSIQVRMGQKIEIEKLVHAIEYLDEKELLYSYSSLRASEAIQIFGDYTNAKAMVKKALKKEPKIPFIKADLFFQSALIAHFEANSILFDNHISKAIAIAKEYKLLSSLNRWKIILASHNVEFDEIAS